MANNIEPLVSIIVPVYNSELYLCDCINSILAQTYKNIEVILINDGSKDSSPLICDEFARCDKRVKVIHQKNQGRCAARNVGLDKAEGDFITFSDNDDLMHPQLIELLYRASNQTEERKISIAWAKKEPYDFLPLIYEDIKKESLSKNDIIRIALGDSSTMQYMAACSVWATLYPKEILGNLRFDDDGFEDQWFNIMVFNKTDSVVYLDYPLYYWRQLSSSQSHYSSFSKYNYDIMYSIPKIYDEMRDSMEESVKGECLIRIYKNILCQRHYAKGSAWEKKANDAAELIINKYKQDFENCGSVPLRKKTLLIMMYKYGFLYDAFLSFMEWKQRHI